MPEATDNLLVVLGPTASGKTRLGVALARLLGGEIISADSRQVYRRLDIGTGKDLEEYGSGSDQVACHLIDVVDPEEEYSVFRFQRDFFRIFEQLGRRGVAPVLVGGSGLYLESVLAGYGMVPAPPDRQLRTELADLGEEQLIELLRSLNPRLHNVTDFGSRERLLRAIEIATATREQKPPSLPQLRPLVLGTRFDRAELYRRIDHRLAQRLETGLIEEVQRLLNGGLSHERLDQLGLEYRYVAAYLRGQIPGLRELQQSLSRAIHHFARRQLSWYRRMERHGTRIHWVDRADLAIAQRLVDELGRFGRGGS